MENCYEHAVLGFQHSNSWKCHIYLAGRDHRQSFSTSFGSARSQIFIFKNNRMYILDKSDLSLFKIELLKGRTWLCAYFWIQ